jgi:hypothetical protein
VNDESTTTGQQMNETNWIPVVASLIGGGAAGAIISNTITWIRNRKQTIVFKTEVVPVFRPAAKGQLDTKIMVPEHQDSNKYHTFDNLFILEMRITNTGNQDFTEFEFGVSLGDMDKCIYVELISKDRHHVISHSQVISPATPHSALDFNISPFNRKDYYTIRMHVVIPSDNNSPKEISVSSPHPIEFAKDQKSSNTLTDEILLTIIKSALK